MIYSIHDRTRQGFTLIELLVVVSIIGLLASVVLVSLNSARVKSRDATRKAALGEISKALELYRADHGTYQVDHSGSGSGANGDGTPGCGCGWFSYQGGAYGTSVAARLAQLGYLGGVVVDPSGAVMGNQSGRTGYLIYIDNSGHYTLWANLENPSANDLATLDSCYLNIYDNYHSTYPVGAQANYCISN